MTSLCKLLLCALALCLLAAAPARAQDDAISTYFAQYVDDEDFTVVYISGKMFDLMETVVDNLDADDLSGEQVDALRDVVQDMRSLRIVTTDHDGLDLYREAKSKLATAKPYEVLMTVREKADTYVDFYVRERDGLVDELLLLVGEGGEGLVGGLLQDEDEGLAERLSGSFTLLSFEGRIDLEKVGQLSRAFEDGDRDDEPEDFED